MVDVLTNSDNTQHKSSKKFSRQLDQYPIGSMRWFLLVVVIVSSIVLWYQYYVPTSVATVVLAHFHMTFKYYVYIIVIANIAGVIAALAGGLADRFGRCNIVIFGLLIVGLLQLFYIPNVTSAFEFGIGLVAVGLFEGVILVATPALVRDFTPQLGRASAMGFWTLGPVAGVLTSSLIGSHFLTGNSTDWQREFIISGVAGLVIFIIALLFLKELSPKLRDQLMVSSKDLELIELRAKGLDTESATKNAFSQMLKADIIGSAFAISIMLIIYYTASGFFTIYFATVFQHNNVRFTTQQANGIDTWIWAANCIALILFGLLSDLVKVRKPFMLIGAVGGAATTLVLIDYTLKPGTSYYTLVTITSILFAFLGMAYATWMAGFTETVESRNPALVATGLSLWGGMLRFVVAISLILLPVIVSSTNKIVDNQAAQVYVPRALAIEAKYPKLIAIVEKNQILFNKLSSYKSPGDIPPALISEGIKAAGGGTKGLDNLLAISKIKPDLEFLQAHQTALLALQNGSEQSPSQWRNWFWVCFGGILLFIPFIFLMKGRWSPAAAQRDADEHQRYVVAELTKIRSQA